MARIPAAELERLKAEVSVERLAEERGVKLERRGKDLFGLCPFHEEKTPSLVISPESNLWHCFGCGAGGDVIAWVRKAEGVSFRHAVELLRTDLPLQASSSSSSSASSSRPVKKSSVRKLPKLASAEAEDQELLRRVVAYYHETLKASPEALEYLRGRGLGNAEMVEHFQLGFANRTLGYRLPEKNRKEGAEVRGKLRELGIYRTSGHEHLAGSLVVPLFDAEGRLVQMYGRKIRSDLRKGTPDHLYLPGPQRGVFNLAALQAHREVILCEAILDALTFWCAGFRNVTTSYGTSGPNAELWEAFKKHGTERVLIAYDRDDAGEKAAARVAKELTEAGIAAYRVEFPKGMDANEYAGKVTPAAKSLALVVRNAVWLGEGKAPERELPVEIPRGIAGTRSRALPAANGEPEAAKEGRVEAEEDVRSQVSPPKPDPAATTSLLPEPTPAPDPPEARIAALPASVSSLAAVSSPVPAAPAAAIPRPAPSASATHPPPDHSPSAAESPSREPPAYRIPPAIAADHLERKGEECWLSLGDRRYRVRGMERNLGSSVLKVNLLVSREGAEGLPPGTGFHVDTLDLYQARAREGYAKRAAVELGLEEATLARDLGRLVLALEPIQDEEIAGAVEPRAKASKMSETEREEALTLLRSPELLGEILRDFERCGVVGEEVNKLAGYLAAVSRKLDKPLAIVVQSNSAAGKTALMDAILAFMPEEEQVRYSAMTGQSLFYMEDVDLRHKILAIAEEEGAQKASYSLKLLQSEGRLKIATTGKDLTSGRMVTEDHEVEGPVMLFLTTTATDVDEELMNRCLVLAVDESREQTEAIHRAQRAEQTIEGKIRRRKRQAILRRHQNAQRLLEPVLVHNPFAEQLTFQGHQTRFRRDHQKYLALIETVTLLHQVQREKKSYRVDGEEVEYIEVTREDLAIANRLAHEILGRSVDELPPQTRRFLQDLARMVAERCQKCGLEREEVRFTRREVREWTGLANGRVHVHLSRLEELEYVLVHSGRRGKSIIYELLYEASAERGTPFFPGLLEVDEPPGEGETMPKESQGHGYDPNLSAPDPHLPASEGPLPAPIPPAFRPLSGGFPDPLPGAENRSCSSLSSFLEAENPESPGIARSGTAPELGGVVAASRPGPRRGNGTKPPPSVGPG